MSYELITSWSAHHNALTQLLKLALKSVKIFDEDLEKLKLERADNCELFRQFLAADRRRIAQIFVKNPEPLRRNSPRLMQLLANHSSNLSIHVCPPHLGSLNDSMFIVDDRNALIRFHKDHVRSKIIGDDAEECAPYVNRFAEIQREGGEQVSATTLGL